MKLFEMKEVIVSDFISLKMNVEDKQSSGKPKALPRTLSLTSQAGNNSKARK